MNTLFSQSLYRSKYHTFPYFPQIRWALNIWGDMICFFLSTGELAMMPCHDSPLGP